MLRSAIRISIFGGLLLISSASFAAESHAKGGVVFLNNVPVLELRSASRDRNSAQAAEVANTLRMVDDDAEVITRAAGTAAKIVVGSRAILVVTPEESASHGTNVSRLADSWASTIRDALALPPLKFSVDFLRVPLGTTKNLSIVGRLAASSVLSSTNEAVARVSQTETGFEVRCLGVGDAQVRAVSGNSQRTLNVIVRPYAGAFPQDFVAEVTGDPAAASTVSGAVQGCVKTRLISLPTATCSFQSPQSGALGAGASRSYTVWVHLRAPEAFDSFGNVTVTVRNIGVANAPDSSLWYSNTPEAVRQVGPLFSASLKRGLPVRFLYHHIDMATQPLILRVEAINDSDQPAKISIVPGDSKPDVNPVRAGLTAAREYLKAWKSDSGEVLSIPPHSTLPISIRRISPKETVSGLCGLRLLEGPDELQVRADALPAFELSGSWYDASLSSTPWRETGAHPINDYDRAVTEPSQHIYPNPYMDERMDYSVGGRYGFLLVGQKPISGEDHTNNLDGNFGVIYKIKATLSNPTQVPTDVDLVFEASAGYMGGLFLVDGSLIQTPLLGPKSVARLERYHLGAGSTRTVEIVTLPVSGGSYPATLSLRPVEVLASAHHVGRGTP
jgi:hypothetical protein